MASFLGHLYGAAAVSAAAALGVEHLQWAQPEQIQLLFVLGVVGGLLPDIDADNSKPVRAFFTLAGVTAAFLVSFAVAGDVRSVELALIWGAVFVFVRFALFEIFTRFTVHRGVWHSWLAMALVGLAVTNGARYLAGLPDFFCWLAGLFVALGYLTHLVLDEISSVDILGARVRRSFGSALKPASIANPHASLTMLALVFLLVLNAPPVKPVLEAASALSFPSFPIQVPRSAS